MVTSKTGPDKVVRKTNPRDIVTQTEFLEDNGGGEDALVSLVCVSVYFF